MTNFAILLYKQPGKILLLLFSAFASATQSAAQNLYIAGNGPGGEYVLGQFNIETCEFCPEVLIPFNLFPNGMQDVVPLPNGEVVVIGNTDLIRRFDPPSANPVATLNPPGLVYFGGGVLAPNGNVLLTGYESINGNAVPRVYEYNPTNNSISIVGELPAPIPWFFGDPFFWNGTLYTFMLDNSVQPPTNKLVTIQLGNPMIVDIVYAYSGTLCGAPMASIPSGPLAGIYGGALDPDCTGVDVYNFDLPNNTIVLECATPPSGYPYGMGVVPPGYPPANQCQCFTDAGNIPTPNQTLCAGQTLNFTNTGGFLDNNDIKQYILFTNPNDTLGSIAATSSTPSFTFGPPLQTGVTYYFAAMAGNNNGGSVDPDDPCLDFSNARTVIWRPLPTVTLSAGNTDVCPGDCRTITAAFTGTAPFTLTYATPGGGSATQTFSGSTGTFQVCVPANAPLGGFSVQATALADAFCDCN